jgi:catechol 2,3-dioxygenase-like lactoylglutathione lyase family enzyme
VDIKTVNTILYCKKWEETVAFYKTAIELPVIFSRDWFVEFKLGAMARLSVADEARASIDSSDGKGITISIEVDDVRVIRAYLASRGVNPTAIKHLWESQVLYIYDPEGNRIEFWS